MASATYGEARRVPRGTVIFRQGDVGQEVFVVLSGLVRLTLDVAGAAREIAVLGPGEFFGELSVLTDGTRTATAEAIEDGALLVIERDAFTMLIQDDLAIVTRMMRTQGQRLSHTDAPLQALGRRLGTIRLVAHALRGMGGGAALPWAGALPELAAAVRCSPELVAAVTAELARAGAGTLRDGVWRIARSEEVTRLLEALCRYADEEAV